MSRDRVQSQLQKIKDRAETHGPKVSFNATSLKSFNEDLNTLEVFAYAHDEVKKLSGQFFSILRVVCLIS